jgi:5'-methylthioadenosine phosphorylase
VLGGSGVYKMPKSQIIQEHEIKTPFGKPSDNIIELQIQNRPVFFLPRHGRGHRLLPSEIPVKANIYALKSLGITNLLAISACGIMRENINPGDMIVPDQIFDRTKGNRPSTFFGAGIVGHVGFADPFCNKLRSHIIEAIKIENMTFFDGGTYICMEGPQFSTRAESNFYRKTVNASVIGMTALPEAKLAREAELCYAMLAMGTDFDCWHEEADDVNIETVLKVMNKNTNNAHKIILQLAKSLPRSTHCACQQSAKNAILTNPKIIPKETREALNLLYGKYLN